MKKPKTVAVAFRMPEDIRDTLKAEAQKQSRNLHNFGLLVLTQKAKQIEARNGKKR